VASAEHATSTRRSAPGWTVTSTLAAGGECCAPRSAPTSRSTSGQSPQPRGAAPRAASTRTASVSARAEALRSVSAAQRRGAAAAADAAPVGCA